MTTLVQRMPPAPQVTLWGLLLLNGSLIALMLALSKSATSQGMPALTYAFWQTLIAGSILLVRSGPPRRVFNRRLTTYYFISGLAGIAIPNVTAFFLVTRLGAGFTGIMYALPPIFTFLFAAAMGLEKRNWRKFSGLTVAVLACGWIVLQRHSDMGEAGVRWYVLGLLIPVMLSIGNIYRTVAWPRHTTPVALAAGTLLAAAASVAAFSLFTGTPLTPHVTGINILAIVLIQGIVTALAYVCAFEIQKRSTPVFYSQLGAVAAVFGLLIGIVWFGEQYSVTVWLGVVLVIAGLISAVNAGRGTAPRPEP